MSINVVSYGLKAMQNANYKIWCFPQEQLVKKFFAF
jgi:hypothetical protein